jgi:hypothetical protein
MRRALTALFVLPLAGCPLLTVSTELPEVCVTLHDRIVGGQPAGGVVRDGALIDPLQALPGFFSVAGEITSARATLRARGDVADLGFLETVRVSVRGVQPGRELPPLTLVRCLDFGCASQGASTDLHPSVPAELTPYLAAGQLQVDVTLGGPLPEHDWAVDIEVCISGQATLALEL